jgi:hypothetical protein
MPESEVANYHTVKVGAAVSNRATMLVDIGEDWDRRPPCIMPYTMHANTYCDYLMLFHVLDVVCDYGGQ